MGVKIVCVFFTLLLIMTDGLPMQDSPVCPPEENINPCSCKNVAYGLHVICKKLTFDELQKVLSRLASLKVGNLLLHELHMKKHLPADVFKGMKINALQVEDSQVTFDAPAFEGLSASLGQLSVARCETVKLDDSFRVAQLKNLKELVFSQNKLQRILKSWFDNNIPKVTKVNFDNNQIESIDDGTFENLKNLQEISVADNRLTELSRNMLPDPAHSLIRMDFSHNTLKDLPSDMFSNMPSLQSVVLSGNELQTLSEDTWSNIWGSIHQVLLYENPLNCNSELDWIKTSRKPRTLEGTCEAPESKKGQSLRYL